MGRFQANSKTKFADYAAQWVEVAPLTSSTSTGTSFQGASMRSATRSQAGATSVAPALSAASAGGARHLRFVR